MTTRDQYEAAFEAERESSYPEVDLYEQMTGHALDRKRLESAARVLACPVKVNPPCWQHGRVIYSTLRKYLDKTGLSEISALDVGTAKGFSALCAVWAARDHGATINAHSVDVIDPAARVRRNTVAEVDGFVSLYDTLSPWPEARSIRFQQAKGENWLMLRRERVHFAFVDGKHTHEAVSRELGLLTHLQQPGDVVICDDVQVPGVEKAVRAVLSNYKMVTVTALPTRKYAVMDRR